MVARGRYLKTIAYAGISELTDLRRTQITIEELIEILRTHDPNAVVMLTNSASEQGKPGVTQLRSGEIQPVELYQVEYKGMSWYELDDSELPVIGEQAVVFGRKVKAVLLDTR